MVAGGVGLAAAHDDDPGSLREILRPLLPTPLLSVLGATLLGRVVEVARTREVTSIYLEVRASNESALRLYDRFGFTRVGVRKRYYDQPKEDAIVMLLAL